MKKLQLKGNTLTTHFSVNVEDIDTIVFSDGFSGYKVGQHLIKGSCCGCTAKYCSAYSDEEIHSEVFSAFPKNSSRRVCPSDAIAFKNGYAVIDNELCIKCGLCLHRCPYAAIQFSIKTNPCVINIEKGCSFVKCSESEQKRDIAALYKKPREIIYNDISVRFAEKLSKKLEVFANRFPDLSEIVVRNTLLNLGICCNTNVAGNNHIRIEFFAECDNHYIIGESQISNSDTLSVTRRILDDLAVLISRYHFEQDSIVPLAVVNGFPNKRTDFYEVIEDINNVLNIQVVTLSYHALFVLNLFQPHISIDCIKSFIINRSSDSLLPPLKKIIPQIDKVDKNVRGVNYTPIK